MTKPVKLAPNYSNEHGGVNAYDARDERGRGANKEAFLTAGKALLRAVGRDLASAGWQSKIAANRAGIAVSGEIYLRLINPRCDKSLLVTVTASPQMGRPSDGALIYVQVRSNDGRNGLIEGNVYLSADLDSDQLAAELRKLIERVTA